MAVEKMHLVNITSRLENLENLLEDVINFGEIEPVDAFNQVTSRSFTIRASKENVELTEDMSTIKSFERAKNDTTDKLTKIRDFFDIKSRNTSAHKHINEAEVDNLYSKLEDLINKKQELLEKKQRLNDYKKNLEILDRSGIDISKIKNLNYFDYRFGEVSKDGRFILKNNYESLPSFILHLDGNLDNIYLEYLDELVALDKETTKLRVDTDKIIANEKSNTFNTVSSLDKQYSKISKDKSEEVYKSIMDQALSQKEEIDKQYSRYKEAIDKVYRENSDEIVDRVYKQIVEERHE